MLNKLLNLYKNNQTILIDSMIWKLKTIKIKNPKDFRALFLQKIKKWKSIKVLKITTL